MDLKKIYNNLKTNVLPTETEILQIIEDVSEILIMERNTLHLSSPIKIVGDVHGQFFDFLNIFDLFGEVNETNKFLFLGDYVDRGFNSVELLIGILVLKMLHKNDIFLLRGNHESKNLTSNYTFKTECIHKFNEIIYLRFCELFCFFPVAALVDENILCVHGGIMPKFKLSNLNSEDRFEEYPVFNDLFWSDPESVKHYEHSSRGAGFLFGERCVDKFLKRNKLRCIVRSHQLIESGFESKWEGKVLTVWSAPNYMYVHNNRASILQVNGEMLEPLYFDKCNIQYIEDNMFNFLKNLHS